MPKYLFSVSGGQNQNGSIDATEEWIEKENKWKITTSFKLTDKRSGSAVAAVPSSSVC